MDISKWRDFYRDTDNVLILSFCLLSIIFIFLGYDQPWILAIWLIIGTYFYRRLTDGDKYIWLTIFFKLTFWMLLAENAVIILTGALQYNYDNIFYKAPHWLPIAYANSLLFIILNYKLSRF